MVNGLRQMVIDRVARARPGAHPGHASVLAGPGVRPRHRPAATRAASRPRRSSKTCSTDPTRPRCGPSASSPRWPRSRTRRRRSPRGIVIAPPARWNPDLQTMETVIARAAHAAARAVGDARRPVRDDLERTGARRRRAAPPRAGRPAADAGDADEYERDREPSSRRTATSSAPKDPVVVAGEAALLTTLSTSITPERAHAALAQIDSAVHAFTAGVKADEKRITLTSRQRRRAAELREQPQTGARRHGPGAPRQREAAVPEGRRPDGRR